MNCFLSLPFKLSRIILYFSILLLPSHFLTILSVTARSKAIYYIFLRFLDAGNL